MNVKFFILLIFVKFKIFNCENKNLSCDFFFDKKFGYTCRVTKDFESKSKHINLTGVIGEHEPIDRVFTFNVTDVFRVMFYDLEIYYIPANITRQFPNLKSLQIKKCGLLELTRANNFHNLRRLYLGFNKIENISKIYFWHFCRLEILSLHENQISSIPQMAFRDLINLKRLSLHGNRLKTIDPLLFVRCLNLEYVDLDNNELQRIEGDLFANHSKLYKISLRNNDIRFINKNFLSSWQLMNATDVKFKRHVILKNNTCIDFDLDDESSFEEFQQLIASSCSVEITTIPPPTTTTTKRTSRTKKPKYKPKRKLWFDYCKWNVEKLYEHFYNFKN